MKLECIEWVDHVAGNGWKTADQTQDNDLALVMSVGWLFNETKDRVTLAASVAEDLDTVQRMHIVKKAIKRRWEVNQTAQSPLRKATVKKTQAGQT